MPGAFNRQLHFNDQTPFSTKSSKDCSPVLHFITRVELLQQVAVHVNQVLSVSCTPAIIYCHTLFLKLSFTSFLSSSSPWFFFCVFVFCFALFCFVLCGFVVVVVVVVLRNEKCGCYTKTRDLASLYCAAETETRVSSVCVKMLRYETVNP